VRSSRRVNSATTNAEDAKDAKERRE